MAPEQAQRSFRPMLVSVIIPAYNAERWIDETLRSVRTQTHRNMEIIVVDDGSSDSTVAIARCHAAEDPRLRIIEQPNAGVAAARNTGWRSSLGELLAFVDADDLWAPTKIERQIEALALEGPRAGLAYCWYLGIDGTSIVTGRDHSPQYHGEVFDALLRENFVGNGSAALVTRDAMAHAGGFEPALRNAGAQGCEDILFYSRVAEKYHFALVAEPLLGYRRLPGNMSGNLPRMLRSWMMVIDELASRHPDKRAVMEEGLNGYVHYLVRRALFEGRWRQIRPAVALLRRQHPAIVRNIVVRTLPAFLAEASRKAFQRVIARLQRRQGAPPERFRIGELS